MKTTRLLSVLTVAMLLIVPARAQVVASHIYELDNSLSDANGGPSLVQNGGTLGATGLTFGAGEGPNLSDALVAGDTYSIEMAVRLDETNGYRRLIDFKNRTSDTGLYNLSTTLNFYNVTTGPNGAFTAGSLAQVIITRDGTTNEFVGYVNGTQQFAFTDSGGLGIFDQPNNIIHFVRDDGAVGGENSSGFLDYIRIYDNPLSQAQVTDRYAAFTATETPEAGTFGLLALGVVAALPLRRRARTR